ncbi:MAG: hypothetical protein ACHRHE_15165 [Tepidisphaerales bacterium]
MKIDWCWACKRDHPMLEQAEFDAVWRAYREAEDALFGKPVRLSRTPQENRETLLRLQGSRVPPTEPPGTTSRQIRYQPLKDAYEKVTGLKFEGDDPKVILHYRIAFYGPPCPYCGKLLRNSRAKQCFECGMDWHDPTNVLCHRRR